MSKEVFGTKEWASSNYNLQFGCENNCRYCYARAMACRHKKITALDWHKPVLRQGIQEHKFGKRKGTIMFPTTHDITKSNIDQAIHVLRGMLQAGNKVLIVSKPVPELIDRICTECQPYQDQILFRFTIGSTNDTVLKFWEPEAPTFKQRLKALQIAFAKGFQTSVSMEPFLDDHPEAVVAAVRPCVTDAIWLGKANMLIERLKMNGEWNDFTANEAANIAQFQSDEKVKALYERYKDDPKIKWKESIKKVVGIAVPTEIGLDI
jgi:DNA repair photolyase